MSRSRRKPYYTDQQKSGCSVKTKREANKAVRRAKDVADGKAYRKEYCTWNIRDWSFWSPNTPKAYRK